VGHLELLNKLDVLLLSSLGGKLVLLDGLLPGVVLGLALDVVLVCCLWRVARCGEGRELALRSSMPGLVACEKSSPLLTLKRAEIVSHWV
jgi:hypothetical protein